MHPTCPRKSSVNGREYYRECWNSLETEQVLTKCSYNFTLNITIHFEIFFSQRFFSRFVKLQHISLTPVQLFVSVQINSGYIGMARGRLSVSVQIKLGYVGMARVPIKPDL